MKKRKQNFQVLFIFYSYRLKEADGCFFFFLTIFGQEMRES